MGTQEFIDLIIEGAKRAYMEHNVLPSLTLAQAALESNWGQSAPGNNLFGIKWQPNCGYSPQLLWTKEYINGDCIDVQDNFRAYDSLDDNVYDHAMFLVNNSRYAAVLQATNYKDACRLVQQCGYATAPNYADSLINVIECYAFYNYDNQAIFEKSVAKLNEGGENGIIRDTSYWLENCVEGGKIEGEHMQTVFNRFVAGFEIYEDYKDVLNWLERAGIIGSAAVWSFVAIPGESVETMYCIEAINNMANYLRG